MKKSVVAAVAASNLTVFSGLVNAEGSENGSGCTTIVITGKYDPADPNQCQPGLGSFQDEWWCKGGCSIGAEIFTGLTLTCDDKDGTNPSC